MSLKGKTVIITGAGGGIGSKAVEFFCEEGCNVVGADMKLEDVQKATAGKNAIAVQNDVTNYEDCQKLVKAALDAYGRIDVLICNAGIMILGELDQQPIESFQKIIDVNVKGVYNLIKAAEPYLENNGSIVITSSKAGKRAIGAYAAYVSSKTALFGLAQSTAYELGHRGIRANCICPGDLVSGVMWKRDLLDGLSAKMGITVPELVEMRSKESPLGRYAYAEDICNAMVFLADSDKSGYITAQDIDVTGGVVVN
jgi:NAD(P)-dependent dehydrogenase (short-subunit alcohol dehydrogenase family)